MMDRYGTIQYVTNNYQNLECPCIIGPGNTVAHAFSGEGVIGVLYYFDENSNSSLSQLIVETPGILGLFQKINFGMYYTLTFILKTSKKVTFYGLEEK